MPGPGARPIRDRSPIPVPDPRSPPRSALARSAPRPAVLCRDHDTVGGLTHPDPRSIQVGTANRFGHRGGRRGPGVPVARVSERNVVTLDFNSRSTKGIRANSFHAVLSCRDHAVTAWMWATRGIFNSPRHTSVPPLVYLGGRHARHECPQTRHFPYRSMTWIRAVIHAEA